ncbi:MAG: hypothetical protein WCT37_02035 [Patescibacteria group bacterium]|jgi:hypothetical protein
MVFLPANDPMQPDKNRKLIYAIVAVAVLILVVFGYILLKWWQRPPAEPQGQTPAINQPVNEAPAVNQPTAENPEGKPSAGEVTKVKGENGNYLTLAEVEKILSEAKPVLGPDADNDGLSDSEEKFYGTDKNNPDTDGDGYKDGEEVQKGYNPLGPGRDIKIFTQ